MVSHETEVWLLVAAIIIGLIMTGVGGYFWWDGIKHGLSSTKRKKGSVIPIAGTVIGAILFLGGAGFGLYLWMRPVTS